VLADEVSAFLHVTAHQYTEESVGLTGIIERHPQQSPRGRTHRRIPQLVSIHLTQPLETFYLNSSAANLPYASADKPQRCDVVFVCAIDELELGRKRFTGNSFGRLQEKIF